MARTSTLVQASPSQVFDILLDPYTYEKWIVGAQRIRHMDGHWPAVGSAFHHATARSVGSLEDHTEILEVDRPRRLVLKAHARPLGIARVVFTLEGTERGTTITMEEKAEPGTKSRAVALLVEPLIYVRNLECLRRLKRLIAQHELGS